MCAIEFAPLRLRTSSNAQASNKAGSGPLNSSDYDCSKHFTRVVHQMSARRSACLSIAAISQRGFFGEGLETGFAVPPGVAVPVTVPVLVFEVFVVVLLPAGLPALVEGLVGAPVVPPDVAGVGEGAGVGNEVTGAGISGIGLERKGATKRGTVP